MIQVTGLEKKYGDKTALHQISFQIGAGEVVGLLGLNGAGKSTTMNILTGYIGFDRGQVSVNGCDLKSQPLLAKAQTGYLPEQPAFYAGMRVKEYLNFICDLKGVTRDKAQRAAHVDQLISQVGLQEVNTRLIRNLSKGYRQRVSFAQALAGDPKVLILDEPTVGLDPSQVQEMRSLIKRCGQSMTVLISSHILSEIREMCSRVLVLKEGRLIADDSPENLALRTRQTSRLRLRVKAGREEAEQALKSIKGDPEARFLGELEAGTADFLLTAKEEQDIREEVFLALSKAGLPLLAADGGEASLEDIFLRLVRKPGEVDA